MNLQGADEKALIAELEDFIANAHKKAHAATLQSYIEELKERLLKHIAPNQ